MLTFENVLEIFQEYLLRDPEEEVLPCKRGYVRLTWNKDSRYCVDGILCQTPEELFDKLLDAATGYQEYLILREDEMDLLDDAGEKKVEQLRLKYLARREALG